MVVRSKSLFATFAGSAVPDGELLARYLDASDAEAFAELVRRHAGMVRGVCRRFLGHTADADDAFQATFLVLVRKARAVSPRSRVGNFLYGVAYRTAVHARTARARRFAHSRELPDLPAAAEDAVEPEQLAALDEELAKLPDAYRAAVVACELEGLSLKDAAKRLGVPVGTLASRLARGRKRLAERLTARGLAGLMAALGGATAQAVPRPLLERVIAGAVGSAPVSELAQGVLKAMLFTKLKALAKAAVGVGFALGLLTMTAAGTAAPEPTPAVRRAPVPEGPKVAPAERKTLERLWQQLGSIGLNGPHLQTEAALALAKHPKAVAFLKEKLQPVKADAAEMRKLLADLGSEKAEVWKAAFETMGYLDPYLAFTTEEQFGIVTDATGRDRLIGVWWQNSADNFKTWPGGLGIAADQPNPLFVAFEAVRGLPGGGTERSTFSMSIEPLRGRKKQQWDAAQRSVAVLESLGTADAIEVLNQLAGGNEEVMPTVEAKAALKRLGK